MIPLTVVLKLAIYTYLYRLTYLYIHPHTHIYHSWIRHELACKPAILSVLENCQPKGRETDGFFWLLKVSGKMYNSGTWLCDGGLLTQSCPTLATPCGVACQTPLSMGFPGKKYWSGLPFPSPGDLPDPAMEPGSQKRTHRLLECLRGHGSFICFWYFGDRFYFSRILILLEENWPCYCAK